MAKGGQIEKELAMGILTDTIYDILNSGEKLDLDSLPEAAA